MAYYAESQRHCILAQGLYQLLRHSRVCVAFIQVAELVKQLEELIHLHHTQQSAAPSRRQLNVAVRRSTVRAL